MVDQNEQYPSLAIRKLYPRYSNAKLVEAENNLQAYAEVVMRIYQRIRKDPVAHAIFKKVLVAAKDQERD